MGTRFLIINGPNLNTLGEREPEIYGTTTLAAVEASCRDFAKFLGATVEFQQSNHEGVIIDQIQAARKTADALIINPAGFSFFAVSVAQALKLFKGPVIEVHISNIHARTDLPGPSIVSPSAKGVICGLGVYGYIVAMQAAAQMLKAIPDTLPEQVRVGPV